VDYRLAVQLSIALPGYRSPRAGNLLYDLNINMQKKPVPYGASTLKSDFEFYAQDNTISYFQTAP
jgi:hypothetical protein